MTPSTAFVRNRLPRNTRSLPHASLDDHAGYIKKLGSLGDYDILSLTRPGYYPCVVATLDGKVIATLRLHVQSGIAHVSTILVDKDHAGKKVGMTLYESALRRYKRLLSSVDLSTGSSKAWVQLLKKYSGSLLVPVSRAFEYDSAVNVSIVDWVKSGEFSWPVVLRSGKKASLAELLKSSDPVEKQAAEQSVYDIRI